MPYDSWRVICPHCEYEHGDASDWCKDTYPQKTACDGCGEDFECWAEYDVTYHSAKVRQS